MSLSGKLATYGDAFVIYINLIPRYVSRGIKYLSSGDWFHYFLPASGYLHMLGSSQKA